MSRLTGRRCACGLPILADRAIGRADGYRSLEEPLFVCGRPGDVEGTVVVRDADRAADARDLWLGRAMRVDDPAVLPRFCLKAYLDRTAGNPGDVVGERERTADREAFSLRVGDH